MQSARFVLVVVFVTSAGMAAAQQRIVQLPASGRQVWPSQPPKDCPFDPTKELFGAPIPAACTRRCNRTVRAFPGSFRTMVNAVLSMPDRHRADSPSRLKGVLEEPWRRLRIVSKLNLGLRRLC